MSRKNEPLTPIEIVSMLIFIVLFSFLIFYSYKERKQKIKEDTDKYKLQMFYLDQLITLVEEMDDDGIIFSGETGDKMNSIKRKLELSFLDNTLTKNKFSVGEKSRLGKKISLRK